MPAVRRTRSSRNASPVSLRLCLTNWLSDRVQLAAHSATPRNVERRRMQSAGEKTKVSVFGKTGAIGARGIVSTDTTGGDGFRATASVLRPEVLQGWLVPHEGAWVRSTGQRHCEPHARVSRTCDRLRQWRTGGLPVWPRTPRASVPWFAPTISCIHLIFGSGAK
jgi:hypothetical protein